MLKVKNMKKSKGSIMKIVVGIKCALSLMLLSVMSSFAFAADVGEFKITAEVMDGGVKETSFEIEVNGQIIPGVLWTPKGAEGTRPLVLFGHGGSQHKRVDNILRSARDLATTEYYAVVAIDGPGHGDRAPVKSANSRAELGKLMAKSNVTKEWQAVIDAVQKISNVGPGPIGYWGVSMGTRYGVPLVSAEPRVNVAILGLYGLFPAGKTAPLETKFAKQAKNISQPLMFVFQRNDELMTVEQGLALYDAFGSEEKTMHINPGGHTGIPAIESESWKPFFVRHLGKAQLK